MFFSIFSLSYVNTWFDPTGYAWQCSRLHGGCETAAEVYSSVAPILKLYSDFEWFQIMRWRTVNKAIKNNQIF